MSHVHPDNLQEEDDACLLPNFRLAHPFGQRQVAQSAHRNPLWVHPSDAAKLPPDGDRDRLVHRQGLGKGIKPGIIGCSHHIGRWRRKQDSGNRYMTNEVEIEDLGDGDEDRYRGCVPGSLTTPTPTGSGGGTASQNITAVQPDPITAAPEGQDNERRRGGRYQQVVRVLQEVERDGNRGEREAAMDEQALPPRKEHWFIRDGGGISRDAPVHCFPSLSWK